MWWENRFPPPKKNNNHLILCRYPILNHTQMILNLSQSQHAITEKNPKKGFGRCFSYRKSPSLVSAKKKSVVSCFTRAFLLIHPLWVTILKQMTCYNISKYQVSRADGDAAIINQNGWFSHYTPAIEKLPISHLHPRIWFRSPIFILQLWAKLTWFIYPPVN